MGSTSLAGTRRLFFANWEPGPINVELLVNRLFGLEPVYRDLGPGILGGIRFSASKPEEIAIHESLTDLNGGSTLEHRFRSTLAHEIGHGRLHAGFFADLMRGQSTACAAELVGMPHTPRSAIACRASDIRDGESTQQPGLADWERILEWQANRYMGALLAPARLVSQAVRDALEQRDPHTILRLSERQRTTLAPLHFPVVQCQSPARHPSPERAVSPTPNHRETFLAPTSPL